MYSCVSRTKNNSLHLCGEPGFPNSQKVVLFLPPFRKMRAEKYSSWGAMRTSCRTCWWCPVLYERNRVVRKRSLARLWPSTTQIGSNMKNTSLFFPTDTNAITWFISLSLSVYNFTICVPFLTQHQATIEWSEHSFFFNKHLFLLFFKQVSRIASLLGSSSWFLLLLSFSSCLLLFKSLWICCVFVRIRSLP